MIDNEYLTNLNHSVYSSQDKSIVSMLLTPFWVLITRYLPRKLHPNVITFTGLAFIISSFISIFYYRYNGMEVPWQAWIIAGVNIFLYQTMDAIDGKQARRLGVGSPLGELIDHSTDAVAHVLLQFVMCSALYPTNSFRTGVLTFIVSVGFFLSHWEHYSTNVLFFGYISGPSEGILLTSIATIVAGIKGTAIYTSNKYWPSFLTFHHEFSENSLIPFNKIAIHCFADLVYYVLVFAGTLTILNNIINVLKVINKEKFKQYGIVANMKHPEKCNKLYIVIPFLILTKIVFDFIYFFPDFRMHRLFMVETAFGFVSALASTRIAVSRMTKAPFSFVTLNFVLLFFACVIPLFIKRLEIHSMYFLIDEDIFRNAFLLIIIVGILEFALTCLLYFKCIARYLQINLFTLTKIQMIKAERMMSE